MRTIIFAGGGTGGHLYPALAIAHELASLAPEASCAFWCSTRDIDRRILEQERATMLPIPARPLRLRPREFVRFLASWGPSVRRAREHLRAARGAGPVGVVAMGGFVAAPVAQATRAERLPLALVNLDAVPGKANRWIARRAGLLLDAAPGGTLPGARRIRPIVRAAARAPNPPDECRAALGLDPASPTLFVTGGSQGSRTINDLMLELLRAHAGALAGWQVYHQTGTEQEPALQAAYDAAGVPARLTPFCRDIGLAWGAADLAISRCGAGAVGEVWANAVPTVFLPYPFHRDAHQRRNAQPLVDAGGAVLCRDRVDARETLARAGEALLGLLRDAAARDRVRRALVALGPADGAHAAAAALHDYFSSFDQTGA